MTLPIKGIRSGKVRNRKCFIYIMHEGQAAWHSERILRGDLP